MMKFNPSFHSLGSTTKKVSFPQNQWMSCFTCNSRSKSPHSADNIQGYQVIRASISTYLYTTLAEHLSLRFVPSIQLVVTQSKHLYRVVPCPADLLIKTQRIIHKNIRLAHLLHSDAFDLSYCISNMGYRSWFIPPFDHTTLDPFLFLHGFRERRCIL